MTRYTYHLGVVSIVLIPLLGVQTMPAGTIFHETFRDGDSQDGSPITWVPERMASGKYDASSGDYVLSNGTVMISTVPEHVLDDTSIRTRARLVGGGGVNDFVGLGARRGSVFGYAAGLSRTGVLDVIRVDRNFRPTQLANVVVPFNPVDEDVILQLDAFGTELRAWAWPASGEMPDQPQLTVQDHTYSKGDAGVIAFAPRSGNATFPLRSFK